MFENVLIETLLPTMITIIGYFLAKFDRDMEDHFKLLDGKIKKLEKICVHLDKNKINTDQLKSIEKHINESVHKRLDIFGAMVLSKGKNDESNRNSK